MFDLSKLSKVTYDSIVAEIPVDPQKWLMGPGDVPPVTGVVVAQSQPGILLQDVAGDPGGGLVAAVDRVYFLVPMGSKNKKKCLKL